MPSLCDLQFLNNFNIWNVTWHSSYQKQIKKQIMHMKSNAYLTDSQKTIKKQG